VDWRDIVGWGGGEVEVGVDVVGVLGTEALLSGEDLGEEEFELWVVGSEVEDEGGVNCGAVA
jgi:hypothetical protein